MRVSYYIPYFLASGVKLGHKKLADSVILRLYVDMSRFDEAQERNMILFVGSYLKSQQKAVEKLEKILKRDLTACVIVDD